MAAHDPYRIVLADDHALIRQGLRLFLTELNDVVVIGDASDGLELLHLINKQLPDMAIIDISMPTLNGIEATKEIKRNYPDVKILILTMHKEEEYLALAIAAGADGFLLKDHIDTKLLPAITAIRAGKVFFPIFDFQGADDPNYRTKL